MNFATPIWLWALTLMLPALLARVWWSLEGRDAIARLTAPALRDRLVVGGNTLARNLRFALLCVAFSALVLALARPQWGDVTREVHGEGRNVMIAIDVSRSMLAEDLRPNRLARAKLAALDLADALPEDLIGLMAFAGSAFIQVPITTDREALADALDQLDIYAISRGGTNLSSAIRLASNSFAETGAAEHALILFTDGENLEGEALKEAKRAAGKGTVIITIGVGSTGGAIIPDPEARTPGGDFVRDQEGEVVRSALDSAELEKIARASDGIFLHLDAGSMNADIIRKTLAKLDTTETDGASKKVPIERFQWPLALGLVALTLVLLLRWFTTPRGLRHGPAMAVLAILLSASPARAGVLAEAQQAYSKGDFSTALERYQQALDDGFGGGKRGARLQLGLGSAAYRTGNHARALEAFGQALLSDDALVQEGAHYNLGNALFRSGEKLLTPPEPTDGGTQPAPLPSLETLIEALREWRGAEEHYLLTLDLNPSNANAKHNLDVVRRRIEELEKMEEQERQREEQQDGGSDPESEDRPEEKPQPGEDGQDGNPEPENSDDPESGEQSSGEDAPTGTADGGEQRPREDIAQAGDATAAEPGEDPVNPDTGFTEEQARRQLRALADEQANIQPLRRRVRAKYFKDW